ncbi:MAG: trypsin-like peptidase domain-containing protein [Gammaproteobacteria bacterium]|nr:trypsin-like peptidase domain-containing protein [Gammaproteobacteria bacterium]
MNLGPSTRFVAQSVAVGLTAAVVLLFLLPRFAPREVVELVQAPAPASVADRTSYAEAVAAARPAVVNVHAGRTVLERPNALLEDPMFRHFFGGGEGQATQRVETSLGSGVLVNPRGYVLTNHHVVEGADEIQVMLLDGRRAPARVIGVDPDTDLAVLRVDLADLPSVALGDSDALRVGDVVLAIGNPFGVGQTVTMGIVSATGRNDLGLSTFENFIQTDAAINPGNSGGALVDAAGNLIGVNTAIFTRSGGSQGIGFAIPVNLAREVLTAIIEQGRVTRGWLGVEVQELTPEVADVLRLSGERGLVVSGVYRHGPAHLAGVRPYDLITAVGEARVERQKELLETVARVRPGSRVALKIVREGRAAKLDVVVAERPTSAAQR